MPLMTPSASTDPVRWYTRKGTDTRVNWVPIEEIVPPNHMNLKS